MLVVTDRTVHTGYFAVKGQRGERLKLRVYEIIGKWIDQKHYPQTLTVRTRR